MSEKIESAHAHRKNEHISLALQQWKSGDLGNALQDLELVRPLIPSSSVSEVDTSVDIFNYHFAWPFYIEAMTGGSQLSSKINQDLSEIAKKYDLAMAVGSQSIALKEKDSIESFTVVRKNNPNGFLFSNIGIGHSGKEAQAAVDMIEANALEVHINAAQEIAAPDGDRDFNSWLESLQDIIETVNVPVVVKEVGFGMDLESIQEIAKLNPAAINVSGNNGTDFGKIEEDRNHDIDFWLDDILSNKKIGISTLESLNNAAEANLEIPYIANGGISNPMDVFKSQMLGASLIGVAGYFLWQYNQRQLEQTIERWQKQLPMLYALYNY
ncbi:MAG: type 2 isopentenyl-diphosphate Delta-isomerase [Lactobacillaceae bacterium]|jgi:isopentenyl-diphosphate delta-isomerase|nr:type 2 isopentenyl-diphosphate Delta-isomerase [Lactobacillaceae bacterium]